MEIKIGDMEFLPGPGPTAKVFAANVGEGVWPLARVLSWGNVLIPVSSNSVFTCFGSLAFKTQEVSK